MSEAERPSTPPDDPDLVAPEPSEAREDADAREGSERSMRDALSEAELAELESRIRERGRPYRPPS